MSIDISNLTPDPWIVVKSRDVLSAVISPGVASVCHDFEKDQDADFVCASRIVFGIMMRRRWTAVPMQRGNGEPWWGVRMADGSDPELKYIVESPSRGMFQDPFTALIEADKWYRENSP